METAVITSVIIVNYNCSNETIKLINGILLQNNISDIKIIVIDNNSNKEEKDIITKYCKKNHVAIEKIDKNYGYSYANNIGAKIARIKWNPKYYLFSNPDIEIIDKNTIDKMIGAFKKRKIVYVMPLIDNVKQKKNANMQIQIRRCESYLDTLICNSKIMKYIFKERYKKYIYYDEMPYKKNITGEVLSGAFFLIRADIFDKIGGFDKEIFLYHEEIILGKKIKKLGFTGEMITNIKVKHIQGAATNKTKKKKIFIMKNAYQIISEVYYLKHYLNSSNIRMKMYKILRIIEYGILSIIAADKKNIIKGIKIIIKGTDRNVIRN